MAQTDFGFTVDKEAARSIEDHLNPLPRSIIRSSQHQLLNGEWKFELDLDDRGLNDRWYLGHSYGTTATWPGSVEEHMSEGRDLQQGHGWKDTVVAWYERDFTVPEQWLKSQDTMVQLTFGACGYETHVWLNGHLLRTVEGEEAHLGEYTSFSYELPVEILLPTNRITVRIADSHDAELPRGKQESHVYKRGGIWYQTYTGAVRSVWIEPIERNRLRSRLNVLSSVRDRLVEFDVTTRIHDPGLYNLRVVIAPRGSNEVISATDFELRLEAGEKRQRVAVELPGAGLWSPSNPNLYQFVAQLSSPSGSVSQIETHFGIRKVEARGRSFYLNNERLYLDGILYQPGTASYEEMYKHMIAMKKLGCNMVRVHIAGIDPRIYALADEIGMLLWVEVPSTHSSSRRSRENHWQEMQRMLPHIGSHPSVAIWSLYNEDWGAQDVATNPETRQYISDAYDYMRLNHPQLLVVDNDGWNHVSVLGKLKSDLLTVHIYTPELKQWIEVLDRLVKGNNDGVAVNPLVVGDQFFYKGQVPAIVSEWGGFGFVDYGGPQNMQVKSDMIRDYKKEMRKRPIAGDVYTQAVSIEDEVNGLIDPKTGELLVPPDLLNSCK